MHSVRDRVVKRDKNLRDVLFWSAACFPNRDFSMQSEEWESVAGHRQVEAPAAADRGVRRVGAARRPGSALRSWRCSGSDSARPDRSRRSGSAMPLSTSSGPTTSFPSSRRTRSKRIDEEIRSYTEEQFYALDLMRKIPRVVFDGPAGTGKTVLAIEQARRSQAAGRTSLPLLQSRAVHMASESDEGADRRWAPVRRQSADASTSTWKN